MIVNNEDDTRSIPALEELKALNQWVVWRYTEREDGTVTKPPFNPLTGRYASPTDPNTWSAFHHASIALKEGDYKGLGFAIRKENGLIVGDLDACIGKDGKIEDWAMDIVRTLNTYTEISPSGTGLRFIVKGTLPDCLKKSLDLPKLEGIEKSPGIEMYTKDRYVTITGKHLEGTPETIEERQEEVSATYVQYKDALKKKEKEQAPSPPMNGAINLSDFDLMQKMFNSEHGAEIRALYEGDNLGDDSTADYKYCQYLAYWTGKNATTMEHLFSLSALGQRDKWKKRKDYRDSTIAKAIATCKGVYDPYYRTSNNNIPIKPTLKQKETILTQNKRSTEREKETLCSFDPDDSGNGDAMYHLYGTRYLWCTARGWYSWTGTHWKLDPDGAEIKKAAVTTLRKRRHAAVDLGKEAIIKCTPANDRIVNGCVNRFRTLVGIDIEEFDRDPDVLNCANGVVCLRDGSIEPHTSSQRFTYCLSIPYEKSSCPEWIDFLNSVVGGGQVVIDYLQKALGYAITGHTREEILFYLWGVTRAGKGTLAEVIMTLLSGPLATMVDFNSFTAKREGDTSNFDLAPLKPSRIVFASESNRSQSLNPAKIKQLTGGDLVRACYKHKDFFEYRPQFKVIMLSNHEVNGDPEDSALWGRVRVLPFPNSFLEKEDKDLKTRLKSHESLKGILYWLVEGSQQWYALGSKGLETPDIIKETTKKHRDNLDYVQQWLDECSVYMLNEWTSSEKVTASYLNWCENNGIQYPKSPVSFAQSLKTKGYQTGVQKKVQGKNLKGVLHLSLDISLLPSQKVAGSGGSGQNHQTLSHIEILKKGGIHPLPPLPATSLLPLPSNTSNHTITVPPSLSCVSHLTDIIEYRALVLDLARKVNYPYHYVLSGVHPEGKAEYEEVVAKCPKETLEKLIIRLQADVAKLAGTTESEYL